MPRAHIIYMHTQRELTASCYDIRQACSAGLDAVNTLAQYALFVHTRLMQGGWLAGRPAKRDSTVDDLPLRS